MSTKKGLAGIKRGFTVKKKIGCTRLRALLNVFVTVMPYTPADHRFLLIDTLTPNNRSQKSHSSQLILTIMDSKVLGAICGYLVGLLWGPQNSLI